MKRNKDGSKHAHVKNIQDYATVRRTPQERAMWAFEQWANMRPQGGYYELLPPAVQMAVDAVGEAAKKLKGEG